MLFTTECLLRCLQKQTSACVKLKIRIARRTMRVGAHTVEIQYERLTVENCRFRFSNDAVNNFFQSAVVQRHKTVTLFECVNYTEKHENVF